MQGLEGLMPVVYQDSAGRACEYLGVPKDQTCNRKLVLYRDLTDFSLCVRTAKDFYARFTRVEGRAGA